MIQRKREREKGDKRLVNEHNSPLINIKGCNTYRNIRLINNYFTRTLWISNDR